VHYFIAAVVNACNNYDGCMGGVCINNIDSEYLNAEAKGRGVQPASHSR
jgi:hypothetical protein